MANEWGAREFTKRGYSALEVAVSRFPAHVQRAILAASYKGAFAKGTWDDCVMNRITGHSNTWLVSEALGVPERDVQYFITCWDRSSKETEALRRILQIQLSEIIVVPPTVDEHGRRVKKTTVWKSEHQKELEAFEAIVEAEGWDSIDLACEADQLLELAAA